MQKHCKDSTYSIYTAGNDNTGLFKKKKFIGRVKVCTPEWYFKLRLLIHKILSLHNKTLKILMPT